MNEKEQAVKLALLSLDLNLATLALLHASSRHARLKVEADKGNLPEDVILNAAYEVARLQLEEKKRQVRLDALKEGVEL